MTETYTLKYTISRNGVEWFQPIQGTVPEGMTLAQVDRKHRRGLHEMFPGALVRKWRRRKVAK